MMRSLHARLIALVLVVAALGLVLLAAVTYVEQRSFLIDRVDQQAKAAAFPLGARLHGTPPDRHGGPGPGDIDLSVPIGTFAQRFSPTGESYGDPLVLLPTGARGLRRPCCPPGWEPGRRPCPPATAASSIGSSRSARPTAT